MLVAEFALTFALFAIALAQRTKLLLTGLSVVAAASGMLARCLALHKSPGGIISEPVKKAAISTGFITNLSAHIKNLVKPNAPLAGVVKNIVLLGLILRKS